MLRCWRGRLAWCLVLIARGRCLCINRLREPLLAERRTTISGLSEADPTCPRTEPFRRWALSLFDAFAKHPHAPPTNFTLLLPFAPQLFAPLTSPTQIAKDLQTMSQGFSWGLSAISCPAAPRSDSSPASDNHTLPCRACRAAWRRLVALGPRMFSPTVP